VDRTVGRALATAEAMGDMIIVHYAGDIIVEFEHETDVRRFLDAMRERFGEVRAVASSGRTRLIERGRYAANRRPQRGLGKPESFSFLGFTFICRKSRRGTFQLKRKTRRDRLRAELRTPKQEMRRRMY
jgi:RNA-directed DNA polymerase